MSDPASDGEISHEVDDVQDDDPSSTLTSRAVPSGLLKWLMISLLPRFFPSDPVDNLKFYHIIRKCFEVVLLSSILLCVFSIIFVSTAKINHKGCLSVARRMDNLDVNEKPSFETARTQQITVDNVGQFFRNNTHYFETTTVRWIGVYSSPLSAPFTSSKAPVRNFVQRQYLLVDYHAFVIFKTSDGMWWALDKTRDGIFASWAKSRDSILYSSQGELRPTPVCLLADDSHDQFHTYSSVSVTDIVRRLRKILKSNTYAVIDKNCQHFSREIFDKFARDKTWDLTTPTDLTSPLNLLKGDGYFHLLLALSLMYELYILFKEDQDAFHFQFVTYIVVVVSLILVCLGYDITYLFMVHMCEFIVLIPYIESITCFSPFHCYRERASKYRKMCPSALIKFSTMFLKLIWYPLCYTLVYTVPAIYCVNASLAMLNSGTCFLSPSVVTWLIDWTFNNIIIDHSILRFITIHYIPTAIYLNLNY